MVKYKNLMAIRARVDPRAIVKIVQAYEIAGAPVQTMSGVVASALHSYAQMVGSRYAIQDMSLSDAVETLKDRGLKYEQRLKGDLSAALQEEAIIIDGGDTSYSRKRRNVTGVVEKATLLLEDEELKQRAEEFLKAEEEKMKAMKDSLSKPPEK
jgi:hypothetical protein